MNPCLYCVQLDCIRSTDHDNPRFDPQYLNRCLLAVTRHFELDEHEMLEVKVRNRVLQWQGKKKGLKNWKKNMIEMELV